MTGTVFSVAHRTRYDYTASMTRSVMVARLTPRTTRTQRVIRSSISCLPVDAERETWTDAFGNTLTKLCVLDTHRRLDVVSTCEVELLRPTGADARGNERTRNVAWDDARFPGDAAGFVAVTASTQPREARAFSAATFVPGRPLVDALTELTARIYEEFTFDPTATEVSTPVADVFANRGGVCQDFAHVMIACVRAHRIPARYVSGYLETTTPDGMARMVGADASHAWCAVALPDGSWLDLDPTNNLVAPTHVTLAWGRDYSDAAPLQGVVVGPPARQTLAVSVDVERS